MKKLQMLLVFLCMTIGLAMAQTSTITGVVISAEDNEPVIGASVIFFTVKEAVICSSAAYSALSVTRVSSIPFTVSVAAIAGRTNQFSLAIALGSKNESQNVISEPVEEISIG